MSTRCAGRVRLALRCPQGTSLTKTNTKVSTGSHWSRSYASSEAQTANKSGTSQTQQTQTSSTSAQTRDPLLPPRPPPGTYPHPFPDSRDDPHSNSMRLNYQMPASISSQGMSRNKLLSPLAKGTGQSRYAELNSLSGIPTGTEAFMDPSSVSVTPVYVIHVKSSSNNTIITLHGPSTPKSLVISSTQDGRAAGKTKSKQATSEDNFSVESNPDAAEPSLSTELSSDSPATPLRMSSTFSLPTANRCVGWASGGSCHYKKVNRSTYEAGYAASVRIVRRVEEVFRHIMEGGRIEDLPPMKEVKGTQEGPPPRPASGGSATNFMRIRVVYTGFGVGRDAFNAAILSAEGSFVRGLIGQVQDKTPIKIGGCRGRKIRRI